MKKYLIINFLVFAFAIGSWHSAFAQIEIKSDYEILSNVKKITLSEFEIIDTNLIIMLDSFIVSEQICSYYSDSLKIVISICDYNGKLKDPCIDSDTMSVSISSVIKDDVCFHNAVGFFYYKEHLISIKNVSTKKFFRLTGSSKIFNFEEYNGKYTKGVIPIISLDDDSQTRWGFKFINGALTTEYGLMLNCPTKRIE